MNSAVATTFAEITRSFSPKKPTAVGDLNWTEEARLKAHYETAVQPFAEEFEQRRQESIETTITIAKKAIPGGLILIALAALTASFSSARYNPQGVIIFKELGNFFVFLCILVGVACWHFISKPIKAFKDSVKAEIFPKIFAFFGDGFSYSEKVRSA